MLNAVNKNIKLIFYVISIAVVIERADMPVMIVK